MNPSDPATTSQPSAPCEPWWLRLLRSLRILPQIRKTKEGKPDVGVEIKGGIDF